MRANRDTYFQAYVENPELIGCRLIYFVKFVVLNLLELELGAAALDDMITYRDVASLAKQVRGQVHP